jgi:hypothetical protein
MQLNVQLFTCVVLMPDLSFAGAKLKPTLLYNCLWAVGDWISLADGFRLAALLCKTHSCSLQPVIVTGAA